MCLDLRRSQGLVELKALDFTVLAAALDALVGVVVQGHEVFDELFLFFGERVKVFDRGEFFFEG